MKSRQLVQFLAVYDHGSISAAAKVLHITQPALTKSMRQLETMLGVQLFNRTSKGLTPNTYGHLIARHGRTINLEVDHAMAELRLLRDGLAGKLTVGAGPMWMERYLPGVVAELNRRRPSLAVHVIGGVRLNLVPGLINGSIDVACMMLDIPNLDGLVKVPLFELTHVFVANNKHPLAHKNSFDLARLGDFPWAVLSDDEIARARLSTFLSANGVPSHFVGAEFTSMNAMLQVVREGNFLAHVPDRLIPMIREMGLVPLPVRPNFWNGPAGILHRAAPQASPEVLAFLDVVREMAPNWN